MVFEKPDFQLLKEDSVIVTPHLQQI